MIYTVSFNPSLDYVQDLDCVNLGYVNRTSGEKILPGGKGINVSMVLKNLGFENQALGFTAGFTGEVLKSMLKAKGVESDFIELDAGMTRINVKIRAKEETEINGQGPKISADALEQLYQKLETLQGGRYPCAGRFDSGELAAVRLYGYHETSAGQEVEDRRRCDKRSSGECASI